MPHRPADEHRQSNRGHREGNLFVVSAPSGAGKTTICRRVLERTPELLYSVSYTTRAPRGGEIDGRDYHFISSSEFNLKIATGQWAEWAQVHGHYYGTSASFIEQGLSSGRDILLDIDIQGTVQLLDRFPDSITIFILPPSFQTLRQRLESRGTDSRQVIEERLRNARREMDQKDMYRYQIVNDNLEAAITQLIGIIKRYQDDAL